MGEVRTIHFTVNVIPRGKQRARTVLRGRNVHSYTPKETVEFERAVAWACRSACKGQELPVFGGAVSVEIIAKFAPPNSAGKKLREQMLCGQIFPTKVPDADNIAKSVLDAIQSICFKNDSAVVNLTVCKRYSSADGIEICVRDLC